MTRARKYLRRIALILAGIAAALVLLWGAAQTGPGRTAVARAIAAALSSPGQRITVDGLRGRLPDRVTVDRIAIADEAGAFLTVDDVSLDWQPLSLLAGSLHVTELTAKRLALDRLPAGGEQASSASPTLPVLPIGLRVDRFGVERIDLAGPVVGTAAALRLAGALSSDTGTAIETTLDLRRLDGPPGTVSLTSSFGLAKRTLDIDAHVREGPAGLIARALDLEGLPEIDIALAGSGPVADWHGRLTGSAAALHVAADLSIAAASEVAFTANGDAAFAGLLSEQLRPLVGANVPFSLAGAWQPDHARLRLDKGHIAVAAGTVDVSGRFDSAAGTITAAVAVRADGAALVPLSGPATLGPVTVELDAAGPIDAPKLRVSARVSNLAVAPLSMTELSAVGEITPKKPATAGGRVFAVAATIETTGFAADVAALAAGLGAQPHAFVAGDIDLARGTFVAEDVRLSGAAASASLHGTLGLDGANADLAVSAELPDLRRFAPGLGVPLAGRTALAANLRVAGGSVSAAVRAVGADIASGQDMVDALIGGRFEFGGRLANRPDGSWQISELAFDAARASLHGEARLPATFDALDLQYRLRLPDLSVLSPGLGAALAGAVESAGTLAGRLDALALSGRIDGSDIAAAGFAAPRASLDLEAKDVTGEPHGTASLQLDGPVAATAKTQFRLDKAALQLSAIDVSGPGVRATGDLAVPTGGGALAGTVRADARDLAALGTALGQPLAGQASAMLRFVEAASEPSLQVDLEARDLGLEQNGTSLRAATLTATGRVAYAKADPALALSLDATGVAAPQATLSKLSATADGTVAALHLSAHASGDIAGPTDLTVAGTVAQSAGTIAVAVSTLSGQLAGQPVSLAAPAKARWGEAGLAVERLQLGFAGGEIFVHGEFGGNAVGLDARLRAMPVAVLAIGGLAPPAAGVIDGELQLDGSPAQPQGTLSLKASGLQLRQGVGDNAPVLALSLSARLDAGAVTFEASGGDGAATSLSARGRLPVRLSAAPVAFAVDPDSAIDITLDLSGDAGEIEQVVPIDPHHVGGAIRIQATVAGTLAKPLVKGEASLAKGSYENDEIGTILSDVSATVSFDGERANVTVAAKDGGAGSLGLAGTISMAPQPTLDLKLQLDGATLVRRDEVVASTNANLAITGGLDDLLIAGQVETKTIEVRLVDALPPDIVTLKVTEVGRGRTPAPPAQEPAPAFAARLAIDVTIPNRLFVRGRGLDSEWQGNLQVRGTTAEPQITGQINAVRGQFAFAGKTFELTRGTITVGQQDGALAALLDIETAFTDGDFTAKVTVTGPTAKPNIALSSTPELPRDEILSRILFGRGTGQLSPLEALQLAQAAASLSGAGGATGVLDRVRSALGVDVLQVSGGEGDSGPSVRAGKYVADGVFVGAKQGAGPGTSAATVEVEITPNLKVESEVGQTGRSEVGVSWQYNY